MRGFSIGTLLLFTAFLLAFSGTPQQAQAACKTFHASHNGTDFFYSDGTEGTVKNKLIWYVEQWQKEKGVKRVRIGKIHVKCGGWFIKYMLPHRNCKAKSQVCY